MKKSDSKATEKNVKGTRRKQEVVAKRDPNEPVSITRSIDVLCPLCDSELTFKKRDIKTIADCKCPICKEDLVDVIFS
ncbi:MAG: hypothetical protein IJX92_04565 [Clostridia bacterium]|nr:hypothetical protein [Clostridia bacterium]